jgi:hypothetical protein
VADYLPVLPIKSVFLFIAYSIASALLFQIFICPDEA